MAEPDPGDGAARGRRAATQGGDSTGADEPRNWPKLSEEAAEGRRSTLAPPSLETELTKSNQKGARNSLGARHRTAQHFRGPTFPLRIADDNAELVIVLGGGEATSPPEVPVVGLWEVSNKRCIGETYSLRIRPKRSPHIQP